MRLFLCGDVMIGRGIDQILPHHCDPMLHERYVRSAIDYVRLAERVSGRIERPVPFLHIWGELISEMERRSPDLRIVNLETSITAGGVPDPKGINYRMHPDNVGCLTAARIDCCILANNHVGDWGTAGLLDTLETLEGARIATAGAGREHTAAARPAVLMAPDGARLLVFAFGCTSSGVPPRWQAAYGQPGVNLLDKLGEPALGRIAAAVADCAAPEDIVMVSVHWGPNWGWGIPREHREFAHALIEDAGVHVIHGHSSHHPLAIEVHHGRPILYGCGDLINDYEGISGKETFCADLGAAYFVETSVDAGLRRLELVPFRRHRLRLARPTAEDVAWLRDTLNRECRQFGVFLRDEDGVLRLAAA